jgi:hypothetical protein
MSIEKTAVCPVARKEHKQDAVSSADSILAGISDSCKDCKKKNQRLSIKAIVKSEISGCFFFILSFLEFFEDNRLDEFPCLRINRMSDITKLAI